MRTSPRARASRPHAIDMVFSRTEHTPLLNEGARSPMEPARARRVRPRRSQVSPEGPLARTRRSCIDNTRDARGPASGGACSEATRAGAAAARVRAALVASLVPRAEVFPEPPSAWRRRARLVADGDPSPPSASPSPQDTGFLTFSLPRPPSSRPSSSSRRSRDFFLALPLRRAERRSLRRRRRLRRPRGLRRRRVRRRARRPCRAILSWRFLRGRIARGGERGSPLRLRRGRPDEADVHQRQDGEGAVGRGVRRRAGGG